MWWNKYFQTGNVCINRIFFPKVRQQQSLLTLMLFFVFIILKIKSAAGEIFKI